MVELRNDKEEKGKEKGEKGKGERDEKKKPGFVAKAVLAAGLMLAVATGCEERVTNNYNCPDTGTQDVAAEVEQDTAEEEMEADVPEVIDVAEEDVMEEEVECVADLTPTTCDSSEPIAEGVVTLEEPLEMGNLSLEFEGTEEHAGITEGIFSVVDECGNIITRNKIAEGQTLEISIEGAVYAVTVDSLHASEDNPWADVSVTVSCDNMCEMISGILNQGEIAPFDSYKLHLDDIDTFDSDELAALVSILDSMDNIVDRMRIPRGEHKYFGEYRITVEEIGAGYTFGSKWIDFNISRRCPE